MQIKPLLKALSVVTAIGFSMAANASPLNPSTLTNLNLSGDVTVNALAPAAGFFSGNFTASDNPATNGSSLVSDDILLHLVGISGSAAVAEVGFAMHAGTTWSLGLYQLVSGQYQLLQETTGVAATPNAPTSFLTAFLTLGSNATAGEYVLHLSGPVNGNYSGLVQVSSVPLPGAALLFGSALMGMGALRRKQGAAEKSAVAVV
jgi:hypothetical protein